MNKIIRDSSVNTGTSYELDSLVTFPVGIIGLIYFTASWRVKDERQKLATRLTKVQT
jgi:hypothetical protein